MMKRVQFSKGTDPGVTEVLSPLSGQVPLVHRLPSAAYPNSIVLFPGNGPPLMRVPQLGYSLETLAFAVCGAASFALMLMTVLGVN
ncbi:MAG: hypothetical protein JOZ31_01895 [Verrucomicrobia bacterium]|nr:hypothetical protein [Verrucomicrobiota bacterium]